MPDAALRLQNDQQSGTIDAPVPKEIILTRKDTGLTTTFATSLEDGAATITPERDTWLRDSNGVLLFDSNKQLLEVPA